MSTASNASSREPWNKGKIVGQKAPFKPKDIWALRVRLQMEGRVRELALFNLGIDSKLRGCDLVALKVRDVCHGDQLATRAIVMQHCGLPSAAVKVTRFTQAVQGDPRESSPPRRRFREPVVLRRYQGRRRFASQVPPASEHAPASTP